MKDKFLPILLSGFLLASCSSVYRSGQTPDDVYYSPAKEVVKTEKEEEKVEEKTASSEDQYLKMKVRNRYRWTSIDDYEYWNDTRYNHCNCQCTHSTGYYYNPYYNPIRFSSWSNPYYPVLVFGNTKTIYGNTSGSNVKAYGVRTYNNTNTASNPKTGTPNTQGSLLKRIFTSSGTEVDRTQRTFGSGGSSSSSGSSSAGSSSAGGKSGGMNTTGSGSGSGRTRGN